MLILFDHGTPRGLARALSSQTVSTDQDIRYQQNLTDRKIAIVVLTGTTKWSRVRMHSDRIAAAVNASTPGSYTEVDVPFDNKAPS